MFLKTKKTIYVLSVGKKQDVKFLIENSPGQEPP